LLGATQNATSQRPGSWSNNPDLKTRCIGG
jgi:hypothetical protein